MERMEGDGQGRKTTKKKKKKTKKTKKKNKTNKPNPTQQSVPKKIKTTCLICLGEGRKDVLSRLI